MFQNKGKNLKDTSLALLSNTSVLFSRTEKVVTALYMVTDCMSDSEPLRHKLRERAIDLVSIVRSTALKNQFETHFTTTEITHTIDEILSFLTMTATLGFISIMNYEILYKEFEKIRTACTERQQNSPLISDEFGRDKRTTNFVLSPEFFKDTISEPKKQKHFLSDIKGHQDVQKEYSLSDKQIQPTSPELSDTNQSNQLSDRNQKIIEFLKSKGQPVSITDISNFITDCSEKTIQRSLIGLVEEGMISRTGEKRWARYSISTELK